MKNEIYVVIAYKWNSNENHSYTVGVFTKKHAAIKCADSHRDYRGMKYTCKVEMCIPNVFDNKQDNYSKEIYVAEGY